MKRSICASGEGKVPWYSMGFWVAMTKKGWEHYGDAIDCYLLLFHYLQKRGLGGV